ncbi:MAG: hypothetical protein PHU80_09730 [Kiritimatiellae bacterium]|nr:hypothetical protein [Kiritimatiellia bacterium]
MPVQLAPKDLPVLFLSQVEPDWEADDTAAALETNARMIDALQQAGHPVQTAELRDSGLDTLLDNYSADDFVVFNQCESLPGVPHSEHAAVRIIEDCGFAYTGSAPEVLALTEDKAETKSVLAAHNIPTPAWQVFHEPDAAGWNAYPAIVKAVREHCSISLSPESVVLNRQEMETRIKHILQKYRQPALVEDFIDGREFHVPLWGNGHIQMLPVVEMDFSAFRDIHDRLCTYDSKFIPASRHYNVIETLIPAPLAPAQLAALERVCQDTYRALGCRDYARLDVRMRDGVFYVLDVNPNADLDSEASIACAAEQAGFPYPDMLKHLVSLAARRHHLFSRI